MRHAHIHVTGIVQGVGMRPFVYREAPKNLQSMATKLFIKSL